MLRSAPFQVPRRVALTLVGATDAPAPQRCVYDIAKGVTLLGGAFYAGYRLLGWPGLIGMYFFLRVPSSCEVAANAAKGA